VNSLNFSQSYLDYDTSRQLELESYGYRFLRINKFNLRPQTQGQTEKDVLNNLLEKRFTL
jgi:very-short-patch-repair endonuclease